MRLNIIDQASSELAYLHYANSGGVRKAYSMA